MTFAITLRQIIAAVKMCKIGKVCPFIGNDIAFITNELSLIDVSLPLDFIGNEIF